jgi:hypothetical protein
MMFHLLTLTSQVLLNMHKITDAASCRTFLKEIVSLVKVRAAETKTPLDDVLLNGIEFVLNNDRLFRLVYDLVREQFQTPEILFESAENNAVAECVSEAAANNPEIVDPVVIISLISQIISLINTIKTNRRK